MSMLTEKRIIEMNNLWIKRVKSRRYLSDIPMQRLTPGELIVLATDSLYEKAYKKEPPSSFRINKINRALDTLPQSVKDVYTRHIDHQSKLWKTQK